MRQTKRIKTNNEESNISNPTNKGLQVTYISLIIRTGQDLRDNIARRNACTASLDDGHVCPV